LGIISTKEGETTMSDNNGDFVAFLAGLVIGGLVGAGAALLLAPQSGEETRAQIRERGVELRTRAEEELVHIRKQAEDALAEVRKQAEDIQKKAAESVEEAKARVTTAIEEGKTAAKKLGSGKTQATEETVS
jgi:gas vesicle protein